MKAKDLFARVTDELVAAIEAGAGNWHMPWHRLAAGGLPTNADGRAYRGVNALWLPMVAADHGWASGRWATYKGWQRHGSQVRRGERGTDVVLWKQVTAKQDDESDGQADEVGERARRHRLVARTFTVFAAEQCDGTDDLVAATRLERDTVERIADADAYFSAVGAEVVEGGNRAFYRPAVDRIHVPAIAQFERPELFYGTLAHEHVHWTGHPDRLARELTGRFGTDAYAAEELVAELGAAMWCAQAAISPATRQDHAAYLAGWLHILKADAHSLVTVASKAQAAVDHLNSLALDLVPPPAAAVDATARATDAELAA